MSGRLLMAKNCFSLQQCRDHISNHVAKTTNYLSLDSGEENKVEESKIRSGYLVGQDIMNKTNHTGYNVYGLEYKKEGGCMWWIAGEYQTCLNANQPLLNQHTKDRIHDGTKSFVFSVFPLYYRTFRLGNAHFFQKSRNGGMGSF